MKIVAISDLHGYLPKLPSCDIVCICGDIAPVEYDRNLTKVAGWFITDFANWIKGLSASKIVMIGGNHDFFLEYDSSVVDVVNMTIGEDKLVYLCNSGAEIDGIKFYGVPHVGNLPCWAFNLEHNDLVEPFRNVPDNTDVLLAHTPPAHIENIGRALLHPHRPLDWGSSELSEVIAQKRIRYLFCGHIHTGNHTPISYYGTTLVNVSLLDEYYKPFYPPFEIEITPKDK